MTYAYKSYELHSSVELFLFSNMKFRVRMSDIWRCGPLMFFLFFYAGHRSTCGTGRTSWGSAPWTRTVTPGTPAAQTRWVSRLRYWKVAFWGRSVSPAATASPFCASRPRAKRRLPDAAGTRTTSACTRTSPNYPLVLELSVNTFYVT